MQQHNYHANFKLISALSSFHQRVEAGHSNYCYQFVNYKSLSHTF